MIIAFFMASIINNVKAVILRLVLVNEVTFSTLSVLPGLRVTKTATT